MPEGVTYTKRSEADEYARSVDGTVVPVDRDGDGQTDGYNVIEKQTTKDEGITSGPTTEYGGEGQGSIAFVGSSTDNAERRLMETGVEDDDKDDLGYRQGGMGFTERGPIRYAKGGAVKGKKFSGSY
tara:strand:- start:2402 stop:2782 length:381 start_codon:yes stop_codon:yes gene_type:complete